MNITLTDLLGLEPRLQSIAEAAASAGWGNHDVSWAVSARGTPPHLPQLRGGEVLLVPDRVARALGQEFPALLREAATRGAGAIVFERDAALDLGKDGANGGPLWLTWDGPIGSDTETGINRLLTECRGEIYRIGSELERSLTDVAIGGGGLEALIRSISHATGLHLAVSDFSGNPIVASGNAECSPRTTIVERRLGASAVLAVGAAGAPLSIVARFFADRIAAAAVAAMQRDEATRPRGSRRVEAVARLLTQGLDDEHDRRALVLALGLEPDGRYLAAICSGVSEGAMVKTLSGLGTPLPAGAAAGVHTAVVALDRVSDDLLDSRIAEIKRGWVTRGEKTDCALALSAPVTGAALLPAAAAEARFVAEYQRRVPDAPRAASFDAAAETGVFRLLFPLRESLLLRAFVDDAIGPLVSEDGRGVLRATLQSFLDCGGLQVVAADRLGIHRNTLTYRLRRISTILGIDVTEPEHWLALHLALRATVMWDISAGLLARNSEP